MRSGGRACRWKRTVPPLLLDLLETAQRGAHRAHSHRLFDAARPRHVLRRARVGTWLAWWRRLRPGTGCSTSTPGTPWRASGAAWAWGTPRWPSTRQGRMLGAAGCILRGRAASAPPLPPRPCRTSLPLAASLPAARSGKAVTHAAPMPRSACSPSWCCLPPPLACWPSTLPWPGCNRCSGGGARGRGGRGSHTWLRYDWTKLLSVCCVCCTACLGCTACRTSVRAGHVCDWMLKDSLPAARLQRCGPACRPLAAARGHALVPGWLRRERRQGKGRIHRTAGMV